MSSELAPTHQIRVDIGGAIVTSSVFVMGDHVVIPIDAKLPPSAERPKGGYFRGVFEIDRESYDTARALAAAHGVTALRLADLAERVLGARALFSIESRPILPR